MILQKIQLYSGASIIIHADTHEMFQKQMNEETESGGKEVLFTKRVNAFIFGHEEAIFKQSLLTKERLQLSSKNKEWGC
jgi:hypothetical protein